MNFDPEEYARNLEDEYLELGLDDDDSYDEELNLTVIRWDPRKHPRNLLGQFRKVLSSLSTGDSVVFPDGTEVKSLGGPHFKYERGGESGITDGDEAAAKAIEISDYEEKNLIGFRDQKADEWNDGEFELPPPDYDLDGMAIEFNERMENGIPVIRMPMAAFGRFAKDGRYKTQHETGKSRGHYAPGLRRSVEQTLWPGIEVFPIYGYLWEPDSDYSVSAIKLKRSDTDLRFAESYGEVRLVLKPEVQERMTATLGDSLSNFVVPVAFKEADMFALELIYAEESPESFYDSHIELQIFGDVTPDHIDKVVITAVDHYDADGDWLGRWADEPPVDVQKRLEELGIEWELDDSERVMP